MSISSILTKTAATSVLAGTALAMSLGAAQSASAATPDLAKVHDIEYSTNFQVTQNNGIFADVTKNTFKSYERWTGPSAHLGKHITMDSLYADSAQSTRAFDYFAAKEISDAGAISVTTTQYLQFWPGEEVQSAVTVTIAPNATRSFWIYTVNKWNDTAKTLVTITNTVR